MSRNYIEVIGVTSLVPCNSSELSRRGVTIEAITTSHCPSLPRNTCSSHHHTRAASFQHTSKLSEAR